MSKPFTVTTIGPEAAPTGMGNVMLVFDHVDGMAGTPLKVRVLEPCVSPKLVPVMVTGPLMGAVAGETPVITGMTSTVPGGLEIPLTVTTRFAGPAGTPAGSGTVMLVSLQAVGVAFTPPIETALLPWLAPKLVPVMVNGVCTGATLGEIWPTPGVIVNITLLLVPKPR